MEQAAESVNQGRELPRFLRVLQQIWKELTLGVGFWGALRPIFAALIAAIPIFFLGQHFNRRHRKGFDWTLLQIPLALTVVLWFALWFYSIFDAWRDSTRIIAENNLKASTIG